MSAPLEVYADDKLVISDGTNTLDNLIALTLSEYGNNFSTLESGIKNYFSVDAVIPISDKGFIGVCGNYYEDEIPTLSHYKFHRIDRISKLRLYNENAPYKTYIVFNDAGLNTYPIMYCSIDVAYANAVIISAGIRSAYYSTTSGISCTISRYGAKPPYNSITVEDFPSAMTAKESKAITKFYRADGAYAQPEGNICQMTFSATNDEGSLTIFSDEVTAKRAISNRLDWTFLSYAPQYREDLSEAEDSSQGGYMWESDYNAVMALSGTALHSYVYYKDYYLNHKSRNNWSRAGYLIYSNSIFFKINSNGEITNKITKTLPYFTRTINVTMRATTSGVSVTAAWSDDTEDKYRFDIAITLQLEGCYWDGSSVSSSQADIIWAQGNNELTLELGAGDNSVYGGLSFVYEPLGTETDSNAIRISSHSDNNNDDITKPTTISYPSPAIFNDRL